MRKLLLGSVVMLASLAGPVSAADLPYQRAGLPGVAGRRLRLDTGFYVGGHVGYAWSNKKWDLPGPRRDRSITPAKASSAAVQGGYNWQIGAWVLGVEAQASYGRVGGKRGKLGRSGPHPPGSSRTLTRLRA